MREYMRKREREKERMSKREGQNIRKDNVWERDRENVRNDEYEKEIEREKE